MHVHMYNCNATSTHLCNFIYNACIHTYVHQYIRIEALYFHSVISRTHHLSIVCSLHGCTCWHKVSLSYPMTCRHRSSFSIRHGAEVGTICFKAKRVSSSPASFNRARNTELKVPSDREEGHSLSVASGREKGRKHEKHTFSNLGQDFKVFAHWRNCFQQSCNSSQV